MIKYHVQKFRNSWRKEFILAVSRGIRAHDGGESMGAGSWCRKQRNHIFKHNFEAEIWSSIILGDSQPHCESQICICINKLKLTLGQHADLQRQSIFDGHISVLCHMAALNAWDRIEEAEKKIELFTKIVHGPKEAFNDFFYKGWLQL